VCAESAEASGPATATPPRALPAYLARIPRGPYRSLNPLTKFVVALASALAALAVRGWTGPLLVLVLSAGIAAVAGVTRSLRRFVVATLPLVASIFLVNAFLYPGATDVAFRIGPFAATTTGLEFAAQATLRVLAFALSVAVFSLTTATDDLLADLERRGAGRRTAFVVGSAVGTIPAMAARAAEIGEAQRARGLDTEGSFWRRVRGVVPVAGPLVLGALSEVEQRTIALEARAFSAGGRRTVLRRLPDSRRQQAARWVIGLGTVAAAAASVAGVVHVP
jgi:energy-coupling factor transport system permease protein